MPIFLPLWQCILVPPGYVRFLWCVFQADILAYIYAYTVHSSWLILCGLLSARKNQNSLFTIFVNLNSNNGVRSIAFIFVWLTLCYSVSSWHVVVAVSVFRTRNKNCHLQNETWRKMPHIALEKQSIQMYIMPKSTKKKSNTKKKKKKMCVVSSIFTVGRTTLS